MKTLKKDSIRFLTVSLITVIVICVGIFVFLAVYMNRKTTDTMGNIGTVYMGEVNDRISLHFKATIELNMSYLSDIVKSVPPESVSDYDKMCDDFKYNSSLMGFEYLALYSSDDDTFDVIYGQPLEVANYSTFMESLDADSNNVASGIIDTGETIIIMSVPAEYKMKDGSTSTSLIAGLPVEHIRQSLMLDKSNGVAFSHIIREDGSFVVRSGDAVRDNYFDRIRDLFNEKKGKKSETYIAEMKKAMASGNDYSTVLYLGSERRHMYVSSLPYSDWFLVTIMPYGYLDEVVENLNKGYYSVIIVSLIIILAVFIFIFIRYIFISAHQMNQLAEAKDEALKATKAKSEFLSNMSHDIRTPMNAIVGMTAIALTNIDDKPQVENCLRKITLSSKHLLGLINDVLDMSKIESGNMTLNIEQVSMREVMEGIVSIIQPQIKAKEQYLEVSIHDVDTEDVYCDSVRLNQMLINLLSNAVKFTPERGTIKLSLYEEESPQGEDYVRMHIYVKDNGIGMSKEFQSKIFESFTREDRKRIHKTEGTGLGMAITKFIVDAMGGTIDIESEQGKGTQFHVTLDLEKAQCREEDMILPDWNMLVVDDDELLCQSAVNSLSDMGIKAEWAPDGNSALEMVNKRHKAHNDYHIVLLDWKLPGISGIETAREIRRQVGDDIPILLISAYDWSDVEEEAKDAGINGFIAKPLFKSTMFYALKRYASPDDNNDESDSESKEIRFDGKRIILAEDNDLNWEVAEVLLSDIGLEIERAENGKVCIDKFTDSPVGTYDAILMDIRMPVMNGYEASEAIRAMDRSDSDIPIIAMTADAFAEDIKKCLESGMNSHVAKPINVQEIAHLLSKYFKER